MGHKSNVIKVFVTILLFVWCVPSFGQNSSINMPLGTVWFVGKSTYLTREAKVTLSGFIKQIRDNPKLQVKAVSFNKDLCDECGDRSWKRAKIVLSYLSKHGIPDNRLTFTNELDGELNKVDLFLISPINNNASHPVIKKRSK
jgi:hypothetical protein